MGHNYREDLMWRAELIETAKVEIERLRNNLSRVDVAPTTEVIRSICESLSQNLDTPKVLRIIRSWMDETESGSVGGEAGELSRALDTLLGLAL
jgi:L-cysteine:1D-myo-inositol 2-amino-2-deoxy-alpha-D-glucopyranoside ligase